MTMFVDAEAYQGGKGQDLTIQAIIMEHLQRITVLGSTEWHGGFWYTHHHSAGGQIAEKRYMPAANEAYSNAVNTLADLLCPFFDEEIQQAEKEHREELDQELQDLKDAMKEQGVKWDKVYWYDRRVDYKRKLFRQLVLFVQRSGLMTGGNYEEEVIG